MRSKITVSLAALALGTALASVTALAQDNDNSKQAQQQQQGSPYKVGRQPNDGGPLTIAQEIGNGNGQRIAAENTERTRPRSTARTARLSSEGTGKGDSLRADVAAGTPVAANSEPPRQYYGETGSWNGNGGWGQNGYYDQYSGWNGGWNSGFGGGFGVRPSASAMGQRDIAACQARFRSFDPQTGTYLGFDGVRHSCP